MKKWALPLILLLLWLPACGPDPNEIQIQGIWESVGAGGSDSLAAGNDILEWMFDNGRFRRVQQTDRENILISEGNYRILDSSGNLIVLELYNIRGDRFTYENNPIDLRILIEPDADRLKIGRLEFEQISP